MVEIATVLHPTDLSECSAPALVWAADLASRYDSKLIVQHVVHLPDAFGPYDAWALDLRKLERAALEGAEADLARYLQEHAGDRPQPEGEVETLVEVGIPHLAIVELAEKRSADLVVMGTHGRSGLSHLIMGSVAERLVRRAPCPVLTVRPPEAADAA